MSSTPNQHLNSRQLRKPGNNEIKTEEDLEKRCEEVAAFMDGVLTPIDQYIRALSEAKRKEYGVEIDEYHDDCLLEETSEFFMGMCEPPQGGRYFVVVPYNQGPYGMTLPETMAFMDVARKTCAEHGLEMRFAKDVRENPSYEDNDRIAIGVSDTAMYNDKIPSIVDAFLSLRKRGGDSWAAYVEANPYKPE